MSVQTEFWTNDIEENLYPDNSFAKFAKQTIKQYIQGKVVHIRQAGVQPNVVIDRVTIPATSTRRVDTDLIFAIQSFTTDPVTIRNEELNFETQDKIRSVLYDHVEALSEAVHDNLAFSWLASRAINPALGNASSATPAAAVIRTSGSNIVAHLTGATGNRKMFTYADLLSAKKTLDTQKIVKTGRYALLTPDMIQQLLLDPALQGFRNTAVVDNVNGAFNQKIAGFTILERVKTAIYDNSATPVVKAVGAAASTADNDCVMCWQENCVENAQGSIDFFEIQKSALSYGNIYSTELFAGGTKRRKDGKGIIAIVQTP